MHTDAARVTSIVGACGVTAYAVLAAVQILVLNPLAAVPGASLAQIHREMAAAGESPWTAGTLTVLGIGVALALLVLVLLWVRDDRSALAAALAYLGLLVCGAPAYFIASFGPGMALADTYGISGGDHAPYGLVLYAISALAVVAMAVVAIVSAARRRA